MSETCESTRSLSTRWLKKNGYLIPNQWSSGSIHWSRSGRDSGSVKFQIDTAPGAEYLRFVYTHTDPWSNENSDMDYTVQIEASPCRFGGVRYWFRCPLVRNGFACGKRIGTLYIVGKYFGCRKCHRLIYANQARSKPGGTIGATMAYFDLTCALEEREGKIRTKYWKGRPTKRYARYLKRVDASRDKLAWIASVLGTTHP